MFWWLKLKPVGNKKTTTDYYELGALGFAKPTTFCYEFGGMDKHGLLRNGQGRLKYISIKYNIYRLKYKVCHP